MRRVSFSPSLPPHYLTQNNALSFLDIKDRFSKRRTTFPPSNYETSENNQESFLDDK